MSFPYGVVNGVLDVLSRVFTPTAMAMLLRGALWTVVFSLLAITVGGFVGLLTAALRTMRRSTAGSFGILLALVLDVYVHALRRIPLILWLLFAYVSLSAMGYIASAFLSAAVALSIYTGAYMSETFRTGIDSVPQTQWEAGRALGFSDWKVFWLIILPQAMRVAIPASVSFLQSLIKDTSVVTIIGAFELTRAGLVLRQRYPLESFWIFIAVMLLYLAICYPAAKVGERVERRMTKYVAP